MEAKDGSVGFDMGGCKDVIKENEFSEYTNCDGRKVTYFLLNMVIKDKIVETFEAENTNSLEMQKGVWQAILVNLKKYAETNWLKLI